jgi:hypothetical protein
MEQSVVAVDERTVVLVGPDCPGEKYNAKAMRMLFRNNSDLERRYRDAPRQQPRDGSAPEEEAEM